MILQDDMRDILTQTDVVVQEYKDAMSGFERFLKRLFDFMAAFCGIVVLSPVFVIIYVAIWVTGGNAVYKQERVGYKGKPFTIYKFRTMKMNAEKYGVLRTEDERKGQMTTLGRFLCEHHLDELPQMFNVLIGDMSLVGPRPERQIFINGIMKVNPNYVHVYKMRPGLTSNATLYNGYTDTMEKMLTRLDMDLEYLTTRSLWVDCKIVCKTILYIISGKKF